MTNIYDVAAERDTLMQLIGDIRAALHTPDDVDVLQYAASVAAKAAEWDTVPWTLIERIAYPPSGWPEHDDVFDLRTFYDAHKPQEDAPITDMVTARTVLRNAGIDPDAAGKRMADAARQALAEKAETLPPPHIEALQSALAHLAEARNELRAAGSLMQPTYMINAARIDAVHDDMLLLSRHIQETLDYLDAAGQMQAELQRMKERKGGAA